MRLTRLIFLLVTSLTVHAQRPDTLRIDTTGGALTISKGHHPLLTYVYKTVYPPTGIDSAYKKSGFIHPLYTPHGQILTRIQPPDHYHHYGIWDPWTHILYKGDTIDCWNLAARKGTQRFAKFISISKQKSSQEFSVLQQHVAFHKDGTEEVFLDDQLTVSIFIWDSNSYLLDITIQLTPATLDPVTLLAYRYGGLGWRATAEWNRDNSEVLTSEDKDRRHADGTTARWCIIQGELTDTLNGSPRTDYGGVDLFANFSPTKDRNWRLEPGRTYTLRYRWIVFNGHFTKQQAESGWQSYAHPSAVY